LRGRGDIRHAAFARAIACVALLLTACAERTEPRHAVDTEGYGGRAVIAGYIDIRGM
jgi:hypothetical protein